MTIVEIELLNSAFMNKGSEIENLTSSQKEQVSHYFADLKENLEGYCRNGKKKIASILRDL